MHFALSVQSSALRCNRRALQCRARRLAERGGCRAELAVPPSVSAFGITALQPPPSASFFFGRIAACLKESERCWATRERELKRERERDRARERERVSE